MCDHFELLFDAGLQAPDEPDGAGTDDRFKEAFGDGVNLPAKKLFGSVPQNGLFEDILEESGIGN